MGNLNVNQNEEQLNTDEFTGEEQPAELDQHYPGYPGYGQYPYQQYPYGRYPGYGRRPRRRRPPYWYGQYPWNGGNVPYIREDEDSEYLDIDDMDEFEGAEIDQFGFFPWFGGFGGPFWGGYGFRPWGWGYRPWGRWWW